MLLAFVTSAALLVQSGQGSVHGVVVDQSGAVLPGVTITATGSGANGAVAVTSDTGRYSLTLPAGHLTLTFSLEGFSTASIDVDVKSGVDAAVATERLSLATRSETVTVHGNAPVAPAPKPPSLSLPPVPPPPRIVPLPEHDRDSICGPAKPDVTNETLGVIHSGRSRAGGTLFTKGDQVMIDGGTFPGVAVGQNFVARRTFHLTGDWSGATGEHTAGVLQIVAAGDHSATAVVVYTCDEIAPGDRLAPFRPEPVRSPEPEGVPAYRDAARILFGDDGQMVGAPQRFMVIDRGSNDGLHPGQRMTLFRPESGRARQRIIVGDAVVVAVRHDSATIRIDKAIDVILVGDLVAPQRFTSAHQ